jgi:hypothetical protein
MSGFLGQENTRSKICVPRAIRAVNGSVMFPERGYGKFMKGLTLVRCQRLLLVTSY